MSRNDIGKASLNMATENMKKYEEIKRIMQEEYSIKYISLNCDMSKYVTFKVGGTAKMMICPKSYEELRGAIQILKDWEVEFFIMGNGSNLIVADSGFDGAIIKLDGSGFGEISVAREKGRICVASGALMRNIAKVAMENDLSGFEFASGIPGSFGGAIFMNAGAYGGEMKDIVNSIRVLNIHNMQVEIIDNEAADFSYRHSLFQNGKYIILEGELQLKKGNKDEISAKMKELLNMRNSKQPVQYPSAGSFFKRPQGYFAGKLIEDAGLKGFAIGGVKVSEKHSGFIINFDNGTATDILKLRDHCQKTVKEKFGVELETEIRILGEEQICTR